MFQDICDLLNIFLKYSTFTALLSFLLLCEFYALSMERSDYNMRMNHPDYIP